jgi:hypothetical protein
LNRHSLLMATLILAGSPAQATGGIVFAGGGWAAIDRGGTCEAMSRSVRIAAKGKVQAIVSLAFSADRRSWGELRARLSRVPRPGSSVMLNVGGRPFLLVDRGNWAWSRGPLQERAIMDAMRSGSGMRIEARDQGGRRFSDPYVLAGAPTAIDAAAARCALRGAGKIR